MLYLEANRWSVRPSHLFDIDDPYVAFCFDQAIGTFGGYIESKLDAIEGNNNAEISSKRQMMLQHLLSDATQPAKGQYADPAAMFG